jgi:hypothetical protein
MIRDRIKAFRRIPASKLRAHPQNWRVHPTAQRERLGAVLREIGFADANLVRALGDGTYELIDGHLRKDLAPDQDIPCLELDVSEAEAATLLATLDPLAAMAEADSAAQLALLAQIEAEEEGLRKLLSELAGRAAERTIQIKPLPTERPPALAWVLIGIPTVRFGEIAAAVQSIAAVHDTILETTVSSDAPDQPLPANDQDGQRRPRGQAPAPPPLPPKVSRRRTAARA